MRYIIAYDVVDDKARSRLADILLDYGERVQKSVFEADLQKEDLQEIQKRTANIITFEDSLRFYPVCESCRKGIIIAGRSSVDLHCSYRIV